MKTGPFHQKIPWRHHLGFGMWSQTETDRRNDFHLQEQSTALLRVPARGWHTTTCLQNIRLQYKSWSQKENVSETWGSLKPYRDQNHLSPELGDVPGRQRSWAAHSTRAASPSLSVSPAHSITLFLFFVVKLHVSQAHKHSLIRVYGQFGAWMSKCPLWSRKDSRSLQELFIKNTHV